MNFNMNPPSTNTAKYKSMLCKHYETSKGCAFKEKCQFAHGYGELRTSSGYTGTQQTMVKQQVAQNTSVSSDGGKKGPNLQNFKIVKCKYWEKDGTCRYGTLCTFAHGDTEIRSKTDNLLLNQQQMGGYYDMSGGMGFPGVGQGFQGVGQGFPGVGQGMNYDPNFMPMMNPYAMGFDPNMMNPNMMNPNMMMGMQQGFDPNLMSMNQNFPGMQYNPQQAQGRDQNTNGNNTNV